MELKAKKRDDFVEEIEYQGFDLGFYELGMAGEWKGCIEMRERELIWETEALRWIYIYIYIYYIKDNYSEHSLFSFFLIIF